FSPALDWPFQIVTTMGEEEFFVLLLPLIYWCFDRRAGLRLTILFLLSAYLNTFAKLLFDQPRPFDYDGRVQRLREASGGGLPSGHAQNTTAIWGYMAYHFRRTWLWIAAALVILLVSLSRIYLGVHFPTDVLGGFAIGLACAFVLIGIDPRLTGWLGKKGPIWQIGLVVVVSGAMIISSALANGDVNTGAALLGIGIGFVLEQRWVRFESRGAGWKRLLRALVGVAGLAAIYLGLRFAFADMEPVVLFRVARYALVGLWGGLGAPWLFVVLGLAARQKD
ncbi:MAG: phosphatase PAP2 family protein, partial [Anaerolineae bacterium]|nr:phosphatase PAP2 family protein [Anaerolineae bacterium]